MTIQATEVCSVVYNRGRIYSSSGSKQRNALVKAFPSRVRFEAKRVCCVL